MAEVVCAHNFFLGGRTKPILQATVGYQRFFSKNLFGLTALLPSTALWLRRPSFFASKLGKNTIDLITIKKYKHEIDFEY